jgi:hypothetical protein
MDVASRTALALGLALALLLCTASVAPARDVPRDFYGTVLDGAALSAPTDLLAGEWPRMAQSGVETVRTVFSWSDAQPVKGGPIDFSRTDVLVAGAAAHGIDLLPVVIYAPAWARVDPALYNSPPADPAAYTAYLSALVARYGPGGSFWAENPGLPARPLRAWQIWNEPQLRYQWNADGFAQGYGALLRASYTALKAADPGSKVILAGATNESWIAIQQLYARGAIRGYFDVVAMHPYTTKPINVVRIGKLVRKVLKRHGDGRLPLWITELGFPASKGRAKSKNSLQTTPKQASRRLTRTYDLLAQRRRQLKLARVYWYTWASPYSGNAIFDYAGLWRFDGVSFAAQPQRAAYVRSARKHEGCRKSSTGACL